VGTTSDPRARGIIGSVTVWSVRAVKYFSSPVHPRGGRKEPAKALEDERINRTMVDRVGSDLLLVPIP
jgi:hypothetical protein